MEELLLPPCDEQNSSRLIVEVTKLSGLANVKNEVNCGNQSGTVPQLIWYLFDATVPTSRGHLALCTFLQQRERANTYSLHFLCCNGRWYHYFCW